MNENNMKRYIDERRRQQTAQQRQNDALRKSHQEQFDKLNHEMDRVSCAAVIIIYYVTFSDKLSVIYYHDRW